jgi:hypothetical protein
MRAHDLEKKNTRNVCAQRGPLAQGARATNSTPTPTSSARTPDIHTRSRVSAINFPHPASRSRPTWRPIGSPIGSLSRRLRRQRRSCVVDCVLYTITHDLYTYLTAHITYRRRCDQRRLCAPTTNAVSALTQLCACVCVRERERDHQSQPAHVSASQYVHSSTVNTHDTPFSPPPSPRICVFLFAPSVRGRPLRDADRASRSLTSSSSLLPPIECLRVDATRQQHDV